MLKKNEYNQTKRMILTHLSDGRLDTGRNMARTLGLSLGGCDMCLKRLRSRGLVGKRKGIYPLQYKITESGLARLQYYQRLDVNQ